jgi:hypothetical protein
VETERVPLPLTVLVAVVVSTLDVLGLLVDVRDSRAEAEPERDPTAERDTVPEAVGLTVLREDALALEVLEPVRVADFVPEELLAALSVRVDVPVRLLVPLPVELLEAEIVRVDVPVTEELRVPAPEADTLVVRVLVRLAVILRVPSPLALAEPLPFELRELEAVAEEDLLGKLDLEGLELVVLERVGRVVTEDVREVVIVRVEVEEVVLVRLPVEVLVLVAELDELLEEVADFVAVLDAVEVNEERAVFVVVTLS